MPKPNVMETNNSAQTIIYPLLMGDSNREISSLSLTAGEINSEEDHSDNFLYFILEGEVEFSYNDYLRRTFKAGELFFVPGGAAVYGIARKDSKVFAIPFNFMENFCDSHTLSQYTAHAKYVQYDFRPLRLTPVITLFIEQMQQYREKDMFDPSLYHLKKCELLILMRHSYTLDEMVTLFYPVLGKDISFKSKILEVCHEGLSSKDLADRFNMSERNFARKFKNEFGESTHQWMIKEKAKRIKLMMTIPGTTLTDVINRFGFTSQSYFWEFCRKQFHCTPQEMLNKMQNKYMK